jgi:hypothetical protein
MTARAMPPIAAKVLSPFILAVLAYVVLVVVSLLLGVATSRVDFWLIDHPSAGTLVAVMQFGAPAVTASILSMLTTRQLLRLENSAGGIGPHLRQTCLLYAALSFLVAGYARCWGDCEGLVLGAHLIWGLAAIGTIVGNGVEQWRTRFVHEHVNGPNDR